MEHHELAKQARYHCAIRPMVIVVEVKNTNGRFRVGLLSTVQIVERDNAGDSSSVRMLSSVSTDDNISN